MKEALNTNKKYYVLTVINKDKTRTHQSGDVIYPVLKTSGFVKRRTPKGQFKKMNNPDKLATLGTQDTGRRQRKQKTQHRKLKR